MKKVGLSVLVLAGLVVACGMIVSCASVGGRTSGPHGSRDSLDWWGTYEGTLPSAGGSGMRVKITLNRDGTFEKVVEYVGREGVFTSEGTFGWNKAGSHVTLEGIGDGPATYWVGEGFLLQMDIEGNRIEGELADEYRLEKIE